MEAHTTPDWQALAELTRRALAKNLTAALMVAGDNQDGGGAPVKKMKLTDLNRKTEIARSTLSKLKNGETAGGIQANPDLETICRLAAALNLPPAFLLMSSSDWKRLIGSLNGLKLALSDPNLDDSIFAATGTAKVNEGLRLAKKLELYSDHIRFKLSPEEGSARQGEIDHDTARNNEMNRLAILTTTAVTQSAASTPDDAVVLTAIGAIFGANFKTDK